MKINLCEPCLAEGKLCIATAKGQTSQTGFRLSVCRSQKCRKEWKRVNSNSSLLNQLLEKADAKLKELIK